MLDPKMLKVGRVVKIGENYGIIMPSSLPCEKEVLGISFFYHETKGNQSIWLTLKQDMYDKIEKIFRVRNHIYGSLQNQDVIELLVNDNPICSNFYKIYEKPKTHKIIIDGKEIKLSEESYNQLKNSLK